jgi:DNA-binding NtrC family response regulator
MSGKVLLVGSDTPQMELMRSRLDREFEVLTLAEPEDALAEASQSDVDVMVLNIRELMTEGIEVLRKLHTMDTSIEVITLNIPSALRFSIESMKLGAFDDLTMPFDLDEFAHKIRKAFHKARTGKKGAFRRRLEDLAVSVAFAEAGAFDNSVEISHNSKKTSSGSRQGPKQGGS